MPALLAYEKREEPDRIKKTSSKHSTKIRQPRSLGPQVPSDAVSTVMPGPIVEDTDTRFKY
jgi:hypothetical protein